MNFYVQQSISIQLLKIENVTNSSVLQIGSSGIIKAASYLYNTGGFTGPAPDTQPPIPITNLQTYSPSVPLTSPTP